MLVDIIAGARPNFMKVAPVIKAIEELSEAAGLDYRLIHTGQHYDKNMSGRFFEELGIPDPHFNLEVGSGSQAYQTGKIMERYEALLLKQPSDLCMVVGDVTSTMACSITAKKMHIPVAHVEGGIRSYDCTMPEEINRMVTDSIADLYYTTSRTANEILHKEGHSVEQIVFVGNTMIDTLYANMERLTPPDIWDVVGLESGKYFVMTLHRPANVDEARILYALMAEIIAHSNGLPIVFPVHPRTAKLLSSQNIHAPNLHYTEPMGYLEFNYLVKNAFAVITDSGGITEETTVMGIPCLTLRENTERPETVQIGTNALVGTDPENLGPAMKRLFSGKWKRGGIPERWDGAAAPRIVRHLVQWLNHNNKK